MTILVAPECICTLREARELMTEKIRQLTQQIHLPRGIVRLEIRINPLDCLDWLNAQENEVKIFWSSRDDDLEIAGIGAAHNLTGNNIEQCDKVFQQISKNLISSASRARYFGGFSFHSRILSKEWTDFKNCRFVLPRFEFIQADGKTMLACNVLLNGSAAKIQQTVLKEFNEINFLIKSSTLKIPLAKSRQDVPNHERWIEIIKTILEAFKKSEYKKVVLARKTIFDFMEPVDPAVFLSLLKKVTPDCFHFLFQPSADTAFIGASPERLYKRQGRFIESEAVAGTRPRGKTPAEDKKLQVDLTTSKKEELEHLLVVDAVQAALAQLCPEVQVDGLKSLMKFKWGQHLVTQFEGRLKGSITDMDLLKGLHPTPAVAGCPTDWALKKIQELEGFDRGWYAGPIGYIGHDQTEFAVAIRSGLIFGEQLSLFAGAGIVLGSSPQDEWEEIEQKINVFTQILNHEL